MPHGTIASAPTVTLQGANGFNNFGQFQGAQGFGQSLQGFGAVGQFQGQFGAIPGFDLLYRVICTSCSQRNLRQETSRGGFWFRWK